MKEGTFLSSNGIQSVVEQVVQQTPIIDVHTHLYPPGFGTPLKGNGNEIDPSGLLLWGIDELLTYHYLIAEVYRVVPASRLPYEDFWRMDRPQQADHIWHHLFLQRTPLSEACRGVLTTLNRLGLDPNERSLALLRNWFANQDPHLYIDRVMELAGVQSITMTNSVFDDNERARWLAAPAKLLDSRFRAVLRIDQMVRDWPTAAARLTSWGYPSEAKPRGQSIEHARRFLREWIDRIGAIYMATSLPPEFRHPAEEGDPIACAGQTVLEEIVLPVCAERGLPLAMMIGSRLRANPALGDAGDMCGKADVQSVANLCRTFPRNRFLVTMLSRENQHELCVAARKFGNLMVFGCWWFLNNPSLIREIERMRFELLGTTFIPQHSDARVLEQLIYKWDHSRRIIAEVLTEKYREIAQTGRKISSPDIQEDVRRLFSGNFADFLGNTHTARQAFTERED